MEKWIKAMSHSKSRLVIFDFESQHFQKRLDAQLQPDKHNFDK